MRSKRLYLLAYISGYATLGGLIGSSETTGATTIADTQVTLANGFNITKDGTIDMTDRKFGMIGMFIGSAKGDVTANANNTDNITATREINKFNYNHYTHTDDNLYRYWGGCKEIGYSPSLATTNVIKVGNTTFDWNQKTEGTPAVVVVPAAETTVAAGLVRLVTAAQYAKMDAKHKFNVFVISSSWNEVAAQ